MGALTGRDPRLCAAHLSDGSGRLCGRWAIRGGNVCPMHGASAPQVREAARRRLLEAADPAAAELVRLALDSLDDRVRLQACRDILDRADIRELVSPSITDEWIDAEIARLEAELDRGH